MMMRAVCRFRATSTAARARALHQLQPVAAKTLQPTSGLCGIPPAHLSYLRSAAAPPCSRRLSSRGWDNEENPSVILADDLLDLVEEGLPPAKFQLIDVGSFPHLPDHSSFSSLPLRSTGIRIPWPAYI